MGGGAIRTAAKAAAFAGARRSPHPPATSAASSVHVAASGEHQPSMSMLANKEKVYATGTQWPALEMDDWEFAGGIGEEEETLFGSDPVDPPVRIVFGPAPTLEEAKEAASDLKEALEKVYFTSHMNEAPAEASQVSEPVVSAILPSIPKHVTQAFSLLHGNPEAQNVVASIASDKNVWEAIMKNEKVMDFYKNHKSDDLRVEEYESETTEESSAESPIEKTSEGSGFAEWVESIRLKVSEMVTNISEFLQDFMGTSSSKGEANAASNGDGYVDIGLGASFMALAVATILVVLVKRG